MQFYTHGKPCLGVFDFLYHKGLRPSEINHRGMMGKKFIQRRQTTRVIMRLSNVPLTWLAFVIIPRNKAKRGYGKVLFMRQSRRDGRTESRATCWQTRCTHASLLNTVTPIDWDIRPVKITTCTVKDLDGDAAGVTAVGVWGATSATSREIMLADIRYDQL